MAHELLNQSASYDPGKLQLLGQAFNKVWKDIAGNYGAVETIEDRRRRLALIILEIANIAERDLDEIKSDALAIMRHREQLTQSRH
jgi:hypothetical protein